MRTRTPPGPDRAEALLGPPRTADPAGEEPPGDPVLPGSGSQETPTPRRPGAAPPEPDVAEEAPETPAAPAPAETARSPSFFVCPNPLESGLTGQSQGRYSGPLAPGALLRRRWGRCSPVALCARRRA